MNWESFLEHMGIGCMGAICLALLRWYQLRGELSLAKYRAMMRSLRSWAVFLGGIVGSGMFAGVLYNTQTDSNPFAVFICGAGAPAPMAQALGTVAANTPRVGAAKQSSVDSRFQILALFRFQQRSTREGQA